MSIHVAIRHTTRYAYDRPVSLSPHVIRLRPAAHSRTPIAAYNALFETLDHFESHLGPRLNLPTLVVMDPGDELVSLGGIRKLAETHNLDQWRFHPVQIRSLPSGGE